MEEDLDPAENPTTYTLYLKGRYVAVLTLLPWAAGAAAGLFFLALLLSWLILKDFGQSLFVVFTPFALFFVLAAPLTALFVHVVRLHSLRKIDVQEDGLTIYGTQGHGLFIPYQSIRTIEMRLAPPKLVQCTLILPEKKFTFTNLELNLEERPPIDKLQEECYSLEKMRAFLVFLGKAARDASWRISPSFQERFKIYYPPHDLERLK